MSAQRKEITLTVYDQGEELITELLTPYYAKITKSEYEAQGFEVRITP